MSGSGGEPGRTVDSLASNDLGGRSTLYDESALRQEVELMIVGENGNATKNERQKTSEEDKQALHVIRRLLDDETTNSSSSCKLVRPC